MKLVLNFLAFIWILKINIFWILFKHFEIEFKQKEKKVELYRLHFCYAMYSSTNPELVVAVGNWNKLHLFHLQVNLHPLFLKEKKTHTMSIRKEQLIEQNLGKISGDIWKRTDRNLLNWYDTMKNVRCRKKN